MTTSNPDTILYSKTKKNSTSDEFEIHLNKNNKLTNERYGAVNTEEQRDEIYLNNMELSKIQKYFDEDPNEDTAVQIYLTSSSNEEDSVSEHKSPTKIKQYTDNIIVLKKKLSDLDSNNDISKEEKEGNFSNDVVNASVSTICNYYLKTEKKTTLNKKDNNLKTLKKKNKKGGGDNKENIIYINFNDDDSVIIKKKNSNSDHKNDNDNLDYAICRTQQAQSKKKNHNNNVVKDEKNECFMCEVDLTASDIPQQNPKRSLKKYLTTTNSKSKNRKEFVKNIDIIEQSNNNKNNSINTNNTGNTNYTGNSNYTNNSKTKKIPVKKNKSGSNTKFIQKVKENLSSRNVDEKDSNTSLHYFIKPKKRNVRNLSHKNSNNQTQIKQIVNKKVQRCISILDYIPNLGGNYNTVNHLNQKPNSQQKKIIKKNSSNPEQVKNNQDDTIKRITKLFYMAKEMSIYPHKMKRPKSLSKNIKNSILANNNRDKHNKSVINYDNKIRKNNFKEDEYSARETMKNIFTAEKPKNQIKSLKIKNYSFFDNESKKSKSKQEHQLGEADNNNSFIKNIPVLKTETYFTINNNSSKKRKSSFISSYKTVQRTLVPKMPIYFCKISEQKKSHSAKKEDEPKLAQPIESINISTFTFGTNSNNATIQKTPVNNNNNLKVIANITITDLGRTTNNNENTSNNNNPHNIKNNEIPNSNRSGCPYNRKASKKEKDKNTGFIPLNRINIHNELKMNYKERNSSGVKKTSSLSRCPPNIEKEINKCKTTTNSGYRNPLTFNGAYLQKTKQIIPSSSYIKKKKSKRTQSGANDKKQKEKNENFCQNFINKMFKK